MSKQYGCIHSQGDEVICRNSMGVCTVSVEDLVHVMEELSSENKCQEKCSELNLFLSCSYVLGRDIEGIIADEKTMTITVRPLF